jgi:protease-4
LRPRRLLFWGLIGFGAFIAAAASLIILLGLLSLVLPKGDCVGVIKVDGTILAGKTPEGLFAGDEVGSDDVTALVEEAGKRNEVKAVVVEINSGGGSVVGSREIYESLKGLKKPKVAYLREVAASGGYYVAAGTDYIVSDPDALTGSIGVRATAVDLSGLFEKIGYNQTVIKSGEMKDMGDVYRPLTPEEKAVMQAIVDEIFDEFKGVVVESRGNKLDMDGFNEVLDGRILTGRQAQRIGLVDETGNRKLALRKAAALANMTYEGDAPPVCEISKERGLLEKALSLSGRFASDALKELLSFGTAARGITVRY